MATKMVDMGLKRKEMYPAEASSPKSDKEHENEKEYPTLSLSGPHAEMMGAEDLKEGDVIEQKVRWKVKRHSKVTEGGKTRYSMDLSLQKGSDCEDAGSGDDKEEPDAIDDGSGEDDSPAMAYITGKAKAAK